MSAPPAGKGNRTAVERAQGRECCTKFIQFFVQQLLLLFIL